MQMPRDSLGEWLTDAERTGRGLVRENVPGYFKDAP